MSFNITIGQKPLEIKFNYGLVFKLNSQLSSEVGAENGAGLVYTRLMSGDDSALQDVIKVAAGKNVSEEAIVEAIGIQAEELDSTDGGVGLDQMMNSMIEEIETSGFFMRKLKIFKKNIQEAQTKLKPDQTNEKMQIETLLDTLQNVN